VSAPSHKFNVCKLTLSCRARSKRVRAWSVRLEEGSSAVHSKKRAKKDGKQKGD
jgi:hypothetical protein